MKIQRYIFVLTFVIAWLSNFQHSAAQTKPSEIETPFSMILDVPQAPNAQAMRNSKRISNTPLSRVNTVSGRRIKAGMQGYEYDDELGGRITYEGPNGVSARDADQMIYKIPSQSKRADNLLVQLEARYGPASEQTKNERIWYIRNPNVQNGQAKIITMKVVENLGELSIVVDRMPISRRGALVNPPRRAMPRQEQFVEETKKQETRVKSVPVEKQY